MENNRDTFTGRMLDRASSRRNLNGVVIDTTSEHLRRKYSILRAIDNDSSRRQRGDDLNTIDMPYNTETMRIETEGNNVSLITSLSAAIDDLDAQIKSLGIQERDEVLDNQYAAPATNQIHPIFADVQFNTTDKNHGNKKKSKCHINRLEIYETPKTTRRYHKPNLESTRKSMKPECSGKTPSPRIESTISTIQFLDSPPTHNYTSAHANNPIVNMPDKVEKCLQDALGNELYNSRVTHIDAPVTTNSNMNASEEMSDRRTPFYRKIGKLLHCPVITTKNDVILSPIKTSETFDRTTRFYRSLSQRVRKKLRTVLSTQEPEAGNSTVTISKFPHGPVDDAREEKIENLLRQVRVQQSIISQVTKALEVCHANKEFIGSSEEVESHRLLLLAHLRKRVMMEELKNLSSSDQKHNIIKTENPALEHAEIHVNNIQLTLRKTLYEKPGPGDIQEWFLVVVLEGMNVWATHAVPCPIDNRTIDFEGFYCDVKDLKPKFKITLEVHVLKLVTGTTYYHEQKYHINNMEVETHTCPSPTKFLKKVERPLSPRARPPILRTSSFIPSGYVELSLTDVTLVSPWPLSAVPSDSILLGTIDLKLNSKLHLSTTHRGFLNTGDESGGLAIWNRRWCVLRGHNLRFWNYPGEQEDKQQPLMIIDLLNCISDKIAPVSRSLCAKPRTLLIETVRPRSASDRDSLMIECRQSYTIIRHLLSCDSTRELVDWMAQLNHTLAALREWNINTAYWTTSTHPSGTPMVTEL